MKQLFALAIVVLLLAGGVFGLAYFRKNPVAVTVSEEGKILGLDFLGPLTIASMRRVQYPGSDLTILEDLPNGGNYKQQIVSYQSDGFAIHALLTTPLGKMPEGGWPAIVFNHGYIPPKEYTTTGRYVAYVDGFARNGYVVIKPDYRGHGESEGIPEGAYYSPAYTADSLNALASIKKLPVVNPARIGMWGHSMGGQVTLRSMVISPDIKAGVIWGGVVASHTDLLRNWHRPSRPASQVEEVRRTARQRFIDQFGSPEANPDFWKSISPIAFVSDISGPLQLHHGLADEEVPASFSANLKDAMELAGKHVEYFAYPGADHNLTQVFGTAMQRSVAFFDTYLKATD